MLNNIPLSTILLLIGGLLSVGGAFWSAVQSSRQEEIINKQTTKIEELTVENKDLTAKTISLVTGGNSYAYYYPSGRFKVGSEFGLKDQTALTLIMNGEYPLLDVNIKIYQEIRHKKNKNTANIVLIKELNHNALIYDFMSYGTPKELFLLDLNLEENRNIVIFITSRNGIIKQRIKFAKKQSGLYATATKVVRYTPYTEVKGALKGDTLLERIDDNYPNGPVSWGTF